MAYACRIERDSISPEGVRLTSFVITFPRVVLAEVVTHRLNYEEGEYLFCERAASRDLSKNSASSRAIPVQRFIEQVQRDPYVPRFGKAQKGMQAGGDLDEEDQCKAELVWARAKDHMVECAEALLEIGVHKQDANRLLEPWMWCTQVVTATGDAWSNFFALRCDKAAHPAFQRIARMMFLAYRKSVPEALDYRQWHLPFTTPEERAGMAMERLRLLSSGRVARVSYLTHDGRRDEQADVDLALRLMQSRPVHSSPFEAVATPLHPAQEAAHPEWRSNLVGWLQFRKLLPQERVMVYNPSDEEVSSWGEDV